MLEDGEVGLVAREGDGSNVHQPGLAVVVQNLKISRMLDNSSKKS